MTVNITQGNTANFVVEFLDSSGNLTIPTSGSLTIVYPVSTITTASTSINLAQNGSFFTGSWGSSLAALGLANWSVNAPGLLAPTTGQIRIIDP